MFCAVVVAAVAKGFEAGLFELAPSPLKNPPADPNPNEPLEGALEATEPKDGAALEKLLK